MSINKTIIALVFVAGGAFSLGGEWAKANINYGGGYYTNLCGGGTAADSYTCNSGCLPTSGICQSNNGGAVRYICSGKWTGCLESEEWGNVVQLGQPGCGKTVQLSLYDKKCRQDDGSWDSSCNLLGYMVWYSGDCWTSPTGPTSVAASPTPTKIVSPTPTAKITVTPTPKTASPTASPTGTIVCNKSCVMDSECGTGFVCNAGNCRNPLCLSDKTCTCFSGAATDSGKGGAPETGVGPWLGVGMMLVMAAAGWKLTRIADKLW